MHDPAMSTDVASSATGDDGISSIDLLIALLKRWKLLVVGPLVVGLAVLGYAFTLTPVFTARTTILPPQQQQSGMASALASLGGLAALTGISSGIRNPVDQYIALMQSVTVQDRLIDRFKLMEVYRARLRVEARRSLEANSRINAGKKDGLVTIEVDDPEPERASALANAYVDELRRLTSELAVSEAQQRRVFFEAELSGARDQLAKAQKVLQASGFDVAALRAEPKAAATDYGLIKAQIAAAEVRIRVLRGTLADSAPELRQQLDQLAALRSQLLRLESGGEYGTATDYISNYREFKYREALFELLARQYEVARIDEGREGALIQVVDAAMPPEQKSRPKRASMAIVGTAIAFLALVVLISGWYLLHEAGRDPVRAHQFARLRAALRGR
jgi:uncharacterized protein involved in exopolysaccharide biosynthesis